MSSSYFTQNCIRNDLRRPKKFPGEACPQTPLASALRAFSYAALAPVNGQPDHFKSRGYGPDRYTSPMLQPLYILELFQGEACRDKLCGTSTGTIIQHLL